MDTDESAAETQSPAALETVEAESGPAPRFAVIWLHGLGADGHDFEPIVPHLAAGLPATRFVFPHALVRPVTLNGGMPMRAWYDIRAIDASRDQDSAGIKGSSAAVARLLEREQERGIPAENIVLAGFSQGGAIATYLAMRYPKRLRGLVALSTYALFADRMMEERHPANAELPAFVAHGQQDPMVPFVAGEHLAEALRRAGHPVTWRAYPMPHSVSDAEIADLREWLGNLLR